MLSDQWHLIGKFMGSFELVARLPACSAFSEKRDCLAKFIAIVRFKGLELQSAILLFPLHLFASRVFSRAARRARKPEGKQSASRPRLERFDEQCISIIRIIIYRKLKCDVALCGGD